MLGCCDAPTLRRGLLFRYSWAVGRFTFVIVLTIRVLLSRRTGHRVRLASEGCCVRCGYDLRGSRHECPECGLPLPP